MGLYSTRQAALLARVSSQTVSRWVHGSEQGLPAFRAELPGDELRRITFVDLVQIMAVRAIRLERKIPLQKIREFVEHVEERYNIQHPFARRHTTYLFGDEIVLKFGEQVIQITGKHRDQDLIRPVVELYMEDLHFEGDLASSYVPLRSNDRFILVNPHKRMGQPLVMPCGYSVEAILNSLRSEGTPEAVAEANSISLEDVRIAQRYADILAGVAA